MSSETVLFLPFWLLLAAGFGFFAGEAWGDQRRHRHCLEERNAELRRQLEQARTAPPCWPDLKRLRAEINGLHQRLAAVSKGLAQPPR